MILIVGLGNPGKDYKKTRHNIGREVVQAFPPKDGLADFRFEKKWNTEVSEGKVGREKLVILLPNTFMNKSGLAVAPAARFFKVKTKDIFVVHDDADLPLGRAKLSFGKHSAGHKGVESVIRALKTKDFWRFRIGVAGKRDVPAEKLILKKLAPAEEKILKKIAAKTIAAMKVAITDNPEQAMNSYNSG